MLVFLTVSVYTLLLYNLRIHPNWDLKVRNCMNLHFVPTDKVAVKDDTWYQTLGQFIAVHRNSSSYNPNNVKFDLDASTKVKLKSSESTSCISLCIF